MSRKLSLIFLLFICILTHQATAQQPIYNQYLFNQFAINPAYAGSHEALSATGLARKQWRNIKGAPFTSTFSLHSPFKKEKTGFGILLSNDRISIFNQLILNAAYSYRISLTEKAKLSFGVQAGFSSFTARYSELTSYISNDPSLSVADYNSITPSFGGGLYFYTDKASIGLSVPYIAANIFKTRYVADNFELTNTYMLSGSYIFKIAPDIKFKPACLIKYNSGITPQADIYANFLFRETLGAGISYRTSNTIGFIMQLNITNQLKVGYAYENGLGKLAGFTSGTHEIAVHYLFSFHKSRVDTPRFF